jgi:hypothetical protein
MIGKTISHYRELSGQRSVQLSAPGGEIAGFRLPRKRGTSVYHALILEGNETEQLP